MNTAARILKELAPRRGRDQAITAPQLSVSLGVSEREVRRVISTHHDDCGWIVNGVLVCEPGRGFYFANEVEEAQREWLRKRRLRDEAQNRLAKLERLMKACGFGGLTKRRAAR